MHSNLETQAKRDSGATWFELSPLGQRLYRLRLGGVFGSTWMSGLCTGVAAQGLSILNAHAMRSRDLSWMAELRMEAVSEACDPNSVPFLAFTRAGDLGAHAPLAINAYELIDTMDHGGCLRLTVEANDVLGLLGAMLIRLSGLALFPLEMHIETHSGRAYDQFWLSTVHGEPPSRPLRDQLDSLLARASAATR